MVRQFGDVASSFRLVFLPLAGGNLYLSIP